MTTRKRALTAQIKPETRNAIMDQLAAAADEVMRLQGMVTIQRYIIEQMDEAVQRMIVLQQRRWWHRLMWWRA